MLVLREEFDDWAVLFDPETGDGYGLNPVSLFIWKRLNGRHTVRDLYKALCSCCENVPENAEQEIAGFIKELVNKGYAGYETE